MPHARSLAGIKGCRSFLQGREGFYCLDGQRRERRNPVLEYSGFSQHSSLVGFDAG